LRSCNAECNQIDVILGKDHFYANRNKKHSEILRLQGAVAVGGGGCGGRWPGVGAVYLNMDHVVYKP
jgi:hypothetical protein